MWIFLGFRFQKLINQQFSSFRQELLPAVNLAFDHSPQVILFSYMFAQTPSPIFYYMICSIGAISCKFSASGRQFSNFGDPYVSSRRNKL